MVTTTFYLLEAKTHLHVGSGDSNYGVIDKLVQRDPVDELPCIYASSLKGAFREFFEELLDEKRLASEIFGRKNDDEAGTSKGTHIFHDGFLLSLPVRSNSKPYFAAICPMVLKRLVDTAAMFGIKPDTALEQEILQATKQIQPSKGKACVFDHPIENLRIEDFTPEDITYSNVAIPRLKQLIGENVVLVHDDDFKQLCNDFNLPVVARNYLENGESKNLWYEQIIPRESRFVFTVNGYNVKGPDSFKEKVQQRMVQIGANASVGFGLCRVKSDLLTAQSAN